MISLVLGGNIQSRDALRQIAREQKYLMYNYYLYSE